ncbi:MAG: HTH domain-containing protein, partial [Prevotellaceae bacterium]|nr:HTH domain-containing protein [Prevotellaceae bacterium]
DGRKQGKWIINDCTKDFTKEIISLIENNLNITTVEIANQLNVTRRTVARQIKQLKEKGILSRIDGRKQGKWIINNDTKDDQKMI